MGGFIDSTVGSDEEASDSEVRCGIVLAAMVPPAWVVVLVNPSGHRSAIGGSGATADFIAYTSGNGKTFAELQRDENYWGTLDAYTPEAKNDGEQAAKMVRDKLSTQARAVIVDLALVRNEANRNRVISKVTTMVNKEMKGRMVIFTYDGEQSAVNPIKPWVVQ